MALKPFNVAGGLTVGTVANAVIDANANIEASKVTANGNVSFTGANVSLGAVANLHITGGSNAQVLSTDGAGNLSWATVGSSSALANGNSNVSIPTANGSVVVSVAGNANILTVTGTGANVAGTLGATGTITGANLVANGQTTTNTLQHTGMLTTYIAYANGSSFLVGSNAFTFNDATNVFTVGGNISANNVTLTGTGTALSVSGGNILTNQLTGTKINFLSGLNTVGLQASGATGNYTFNLPTSTGSNGQVLVGDGTGNLSWANVDASGAISNGNSNVSIPSANGNVVVSVAGNANVLTISGTGANITGTLNVSANANFANLGGEQLVVSNLANVANLTVTATANLGNVANVKILNGTSGQFLKTDGTGNLSWDTISTTQIANGNSNVSIPAANGNVVISAAGNANVLTITGTGANVAGQLDVSGNVTAANVSVNALIVTASLAVNSLSNTQVAYANGGNGVVGSSAFTFNDTSNTLAVNGNISSNNLTLTGNATLGQTGQNQLVNLSNTIVELRGGWDVSDQAAVSLIAGNYTANVNWARFIVDGNANGNSTTITTSNISYWRTPGGTANIVTINQVANTSSNIDTGAIVVGGGIGVSGTSHFGANLVITGDIANANNVTVTNNVAANNANFTANVTAGNANLGNLAIANFVQTGQIINGNSNVVLTANGNLLVSVRGLANIMTVSNVGANVVGYVQANGNGSFGALYSPSLTSNSSALTLTAAAGNNNVVLVPTGTGVVDVSGKNVSSVADPVSPQDAATKAYVDSVATGLQIHTAVRVTSVTNLSATYAPGGTTHTTIAITGGNTIQFSAAHGLSVGDEIYWTNSFNGITGQNGYFVVTTPASDTITVKATYTGSEVTTLTNGSGLSQAARANSGDGATLTNSGANAALAIDGVTLSGGDRVLVQGQTSTTENGIYTVTTAGNGSTAWVLTRSTTENSYAPSSISSLGYGDYFFVSQGTSYAGSSYVVTAPTGEIVFGVTGITFSQFAAAGSYTAGSGISITGTVISANVDDVTTAIVSGNIAVKANAQLTTPNIGAATGTSIDLTGNVLAGNINSNAKVTAANVEVTANILANNVSANSNIIANNATVNLALTGNTANFSGNVILPNLTVNLAIAGNTANFTGNLAAQFIKAGNGTPIANLTNPLFSGIANANNYVQAYVFNQSNGTAASADFIAYPDNGTDVSGWVDMGITSSTFNAASYTVTEKNEGYVFMSAPFGSSTSGNLVIATDSTGANNSIEFFVGGFTKTKAQRSLLIANTGVTVTGNLTAGNANLGNLVIANFFQGDGGLLTNVAATGSLSNGNSNVTIAANGNITMGVTGNANVIVVTPTGANVTGTLDATGNVTGANLVTAGVVSAANTLVGGATLTTTSTSAAQVIVKVAATNGKVVEFLVKGVDGTAKYGAATLLAQVGTASNGDCDYTTYGVLTTGSSPGDLSVALVDANANVALLVQPTSSNSTVWTTQYRVL